MTNEEIDALNAGRPLDKIVSELVMNDYSKLDDESFHTMIPLEALLPHYSTLIEDAWKIAEHMTKNRYWFDLSYNGSDSSVRIDRRDNIWIVVTETDYNNTSMPLAICKAALKAIARK